VGLDETRENVDGVHLDTGDVACEQLVGNFYRLNDVRFGLEGAWYSLSCVENSTFIAPLASSSIGEAG
jgi:hypothetical protein